MEPYRRAQRVSRNARNIENLTIFKKNKTVAFKQNLENLVILEDLKVS